MLSQAALIAKPPCQKAFTRGILEVNEILILNDLRLLGATQKECIMVHLLQFKIIVTVY